MVIAGTGLRSNSVKRFPNKLSYNEIFKMNSSVWRDIRSRNGSQSGIVRLHEGNRVWRVSPDKVLHCFSWQSHFRLEVLGGSSSRAGNMGWIREPEPFSGKDPTKLKAFLFQCRLYFRGSSNFKDRSKRVTFALSYLWDVAQEWFEPRISSLTDNYPE